MATVATVAIEPAALRVLRAARRAHPALRAQRRRVVVLRLGVQRERRAHEGARHPGHGERGADHALARPGCGRGRRCLDAPAAVAGSGRRRRELGDGDRGRVRAGRELHGRPPRLTIVGVDGDRVRSRIEREGVRPPRALDPSPSQCTWNPGTSATSGGTTITRCESLASRLTARLRATDSRGSCRNAAMACACSKVIHALAV